MSEELHKTSRSLLSAYRKGRKAGEHGGQRSDCPYPDRRGGCYGQVTTWSRTFRNYWFDGFDDATAKKPERYTA